MRLSALLRQPLLFFCALFFFTSMAFGQGILNVSMSSTPACSLDGSATATVTGGVPPYDFTWYGPSSNYNTGAVNVLTGVSGGGYWLYVTDQNSNWGSASFVIAPPFTASVNTTNDVCNAGVGTATASVSGGTGP